MIAQLSGTLIRISGAQIIIDVGGVGYLATVSRRSLEQIGGLGETVTILTEMIVREDSMTLYGFADADEQQAFGLLQTVQGVGAKAALAILSVLSPEALRQAIMASDKAMVTRADGVGPKLAQRIVNELAEKIGKLSLGGAASIDTGDAAAGTISSGQAASGTGGAAHQEAALSALVNLGYGRVEAWQAVTNALAETPDMSESALIGAALRQLGSRL